MDAPRIRYVQTNDGLSIALWSLGHGEPVIDMGTPPFSHIQLEWDIPEIRAWYERLASRHQLIRYDGRGTGLSEREIEAYSIDGQVSDLEAVVEKLALTSFTLIGSINSGAAAISYAAKWPERVRRLVLWCAYTKGSEFFADSGTAALRGMVHQNWHMFTETAARARFDWNEERLSASFAALIRAAVRPDVQAALMDALREIDVTPLLPAVSMPVLVLQRQNRGIEVARRIGSAIPQAQVVLLPGGSGAPYLHDADEIWSIIEGFINPELGGDARLSKRETEVLRLIAAGKSNQEMADELVISVRTVERHIANLYAKAGLHTKAQATAYAHHLGIA